MKALTKYISEKLIINKNYESFAFINIDEYLNAEHFVIFQFMNLTYHSQTIKEFRLDLIKLKKITEKNKEKDYVFEGDSVINGGSWQLNTSFYENILLSRTENSTYIIYPLSYFKNNINFKELFNYILKSKNVELEKLNKFLHVDIYYYMFKKFVKKIDKTLSNKFYKLNTDLLEVQEKIKNFNQ